MNPVPQNTVSCEKKKKKKREATLFFSGNRDVFCRSGQRRPGREQQADGEEAVGHAARPCLRSGGRRPAWYTLSVWLHTSLASSPPRASHISARLTTLFSSRHARRPPPLCRQMFAPVCYVTPPRLAVISVRRDHVQARWLSRHQDP